MTKDAPAGVLWDMDGTLIDSEHAWHAGAEQLVVNHGGTWTTKVAHALIGASMETTASVLADAGVALDGDQIVLALTEAVEEHLAAQVEFRAGALELFAAIDAAAVPQALATMSYRPLVDIATDAMSAKGLRFGATVAGDDVALGKPDPDAYLRAAALLDVDITDCVVIEDSTPGVLAGLASGATVIAAPLYASSPESAHLTVSSLEELTTLDMFGTHRSRTVPLMKERA